MQFSKSVRNRDLFASPSLHTTVKLERYAASKTCRVCDKPIETGTLYRARTYFDGCAHIGCGWFRSDEKGLRLVRRPGADQEIVEWRCPTCGLDASALRPPLACELRCKRCRGTGPLERFDVVCLRAGTAGPRDRAIVGTVDCEDARVMIAEGPRRGMIIKVRVTDLVRS
jgi:hypothetical protein